MGWDNPIATQEMYWIVNLFIFVLSLYIHMLVRLFIFIDSILSTVALLSNVKFQLGCIEVVYTDIHPFPIPKRKKSFILRSKSI